MSLKEKFDNLPVSLQSGLVGGAGVWGLSALGVIGGSFTSVLLISVAVGAISGVAGESIKEWWIKRQQAKAIREEELKAAMIEKARLEKEIAMAEDPMWVSLQWVKDNIKLLPPSQHPRMNAFVQEFEKAAKTVLIDDSTAAVSDKTTLTTIITRSVPSLMRTLIKVVPIHQNRANEDGVTPLELYAKGIEHNFSQLKVMLDLRHERATSALQVQVDISEQHLVRIGGGEDIADVASSPEIAAENMQRYHDNQRQ
jgi:hypothetical protein